MSMASAYMALIRNKDWRTLFVSVLRDLEWHEHWRFAPWIEDQTKPHSTLPMGDSKTQRDMVRYLWAMSAGETPDPELLQDIRAHADRQTGSVFDELEVENQI